MAKKQGYKDEEDESIGMRLGKKKTKHDKKVARDESYGKWGKRSKDWKAKSGTMVTAQGGTMIKAKKGWGKKLAKAAVAAGAAYAGSKYLKSQGMKGNVSKTAAMEDANIKSGLIDAISGGTKFAKKKAAGKPVYSDFWGGAKKGGTVKAKHGKMVKARGGVIVNTKLNGPLFTETF